MEGKSQEDGMEETQTTRGEFGCGRKGKVGEGPGTGVGLETAE